MTPIKWSLIMLSFAASLLMIAAQVQSDRCIPGYVWREAFPGDHVCVTPQTRSQAAYDNSQASARVDPGGAYGPNTCIQGYVWRAARPSDLVCVTPAIRDKTAYDNSQAKNRQVGDDQYTYKKPRWNDYQLDWCLGWGTQCGKPAADNFCMRRRWTGALDFAAAPNIGAQEPTMVSSTNQVCDQSTCTGFSYITCYGKISYERVFANPKWNNLRLDECYTWDTGCGKRAADAFCRLDPEAQRHGYTKSFYYVVDPGPSSSDTISIGTGEVCGVNDYECYGFQMIICQ
jgi:hypothetical protein